MKVTKWIFTEAQTGKGRLDTHFAYVMMILYSYIWDGNDIETEEDIFKAFSSRSAIRGTVAILLDVAGLNGPTLKKKTQGKHWMQINSWN